MRVLLRLPLIFFFIAALLGLVLRWHRYQSIEGLKYPYWLHAHSHVMFLGWVVNALLVGFVLTMLPADRHKRYTVWLATISFLVAAMLILFPLQGYGVFSIAISTLHTLLIVVVTVMFFKDSRHLKVYEPIAFARMSLIFFSISAVGPFALGALVANGLGHTPWYHLAVYYYLHFQYNGVFTFGVFALFLQLLNDYGAAPDWSVIKRFRLLFFVASFPAYALSVLWTNPSRIFHATGFFAALLQLVALVFLLRALRSNMAQWFTKFSPHSRVLIIAAGSAFLLKLLLQLISSHPTVAILAYNVRFYVIAYMHLVLIGMISFFLVALYNEMKVISLDRITLFLLLAGFVGSEVLMISVGYIPMRQIHTFIFVATLLLATGVGSLMVRGLLTRQRGSSG